VDWVPDDPALPFREIKLATKPWERRKIAYNRLQIVTYSYALANRPGQFDVSNMESPGIQVFEERDYLPRMAKGSISAAWGEARKTYIKGIKVIEKGEWEAKPEKPVLCKGDRPLWGCDYYDVCPIEMEKKTIEVIANEYF